MEEPVSENLQFKKIELPDSRNAYIPEDIELQFPKSDLPTEMTHYLAFIPWNDKYLSLVPDRYKIFFGRVLPYLHTRTSDVHTATCLPLLEKMLKETPYSINENLAYIALILHDSGWSQLNDKEVADSLSYSGLALSAAAKAPKNRHMELGSELSKKLLDGYNFDPPLSPDEKKAICKIVLYHDVTKEVIDKGVVTPELYLVSDADRLWSYTHQNFWQDTIRKAVEPADYIRNLSSELEGYFYTPQGRGLAQKLLADRQKEVAQYPA